MKNNLPIIRENRDVAVVLKKTKYLMSITKKILAKSSKSKELANPKVWQDPDTKLMWQVEIEDERYSWKEAFKYAEKLNSENYGGYSDWRVPNREELMSILTKEYLENSNSYTGETYIKKPLLESITMVNQWFWTSETYPDDSSKAWFVYFNKGYDYWINKSYGNYVRCVR